MEDKVTILKFENHLKEAMFFMIYPPIKELLVKPGGHFQIKIVEPAGLHIGHSELVKQRCKGTAELDIDINASCTIYLVEDGAEEKIW